MSVPPDDPQTFCLLNQRRHHDGRALPVRPPPCSGGVEHAHLGFGPGQALHLAARRRDPPPSPRTRAGPPAECRSAVVPTTPWRSPSLDWMREVDRVPTDTPSASPG